MLRVTTVVLGVAAALLAALLTSAAPAIADQTSYLNRLQTTYTYLSRDQLLAEGMKVCNATRSGMPSSDAINMVTKDLGVGVPVAFEIVVAAVVELGC